MNFDLAFSFILHTRPFKESSVLAEIFTRDYGKYGVIIKGAKRAKSSWRGLISAFIPLYISARGRQELLTVCTMEQAKKAIVLKPKALFSGLYLNELLMRLLPRQDAFPELFDQYHDLLHILECEEGEALSIKFRIFELEVIKSLGYGIDLQKDADHNTIQALSRYDFNLQKGLLPVGEEKRSISGDTLLQFAQGKVSSESLLELKWLTRRIITMLLGENTLHTAHYFKYNFVKNPALKGVSS